MPPENQELETLISRHLDGEASAEQRRELNEVLSRDRTARALYDEYAALDAEAAAVLRRVMGSSNGHRSLRWAPWFVTVVAAAAALVAAIGPRWMTHPGAAPGNGLRTHAGPGWFMPPGESPGATANAVDVLVDPTAVPARRSSRDFILIPGSRPGEILLIEVRRPRATRAVELHGL